MTETKRRRYNSPLREQQMAETRQRLIQAGVELVQEIPDWDWKNLTFRAVGKHAGISERTVYRHFSSERELRDAVMERMVSESGVDISKLELDNFSDVAERIFAYMAAVKAPPALVEDPTLASMDQLRREALLSAVVRAKPDWGEQDQKHLAAMLDILWDLPSYERLLAAWDFSSEQASGVISRMIQLLIDNYKPE